MGNYVFRAKRADNGKWVCGSLLRWKDGHTEIMTNEKPEGIDIKMDKFTVIADTVGMETGFIDKNKKMIYGGDMIRRTWISVSGATKHGEINLVVFENGCFVLKRPDKCYRSRLHPTGSLLYEEYRHIEEVNKNIRR